MLTGETLKGKNKSRESKPTHISKQYEIRTQASTNEKLENMPIPTTAFTAILKVSDATFQAR